MVNPMEIADSKGIWVNMPMVSPTEIADSRGILVLMLCKIKVSGSCVKLSFPNIYFLQTATLNKKQ